MQSSNSFSFVSISLARVAFSLVNLRNVFQLTASSVNTDASTWLLPSDLFRTYSQTFGRVANSHKANEFSRATLCATCENRVTKLHKPDFTCHNLACKPPRNARTRTTLGHFETVRLRANSGRTEPGSNGGYDRGWSARRQELSVIRYTYT